MFQDLRKVTYAVAGWRALTAVLIGVGVAASDLDGMLLTAWFAVPAVLIAFGWRWALWLGAFVSGFEVAAGLLLGAGGNPAKSSGMWLVTLGALVSSGPQLAGCIYALRRGRREATVP